MNEKHHHHFCVTLYLFNPDGSKTLLIKHKKLNWFLPVGGHIEPEEDYLDALIRECNEELGLIKFNLPSYLHPIKFGTRQPLVIQRNQISLDHIHDDLVFAGITSEQEILQPQQGESQEFDWFHCNEIDNIFTSAEVIKHVKNISQLISNNN